MSRIQAQETKEKLRLKLFYSSSEISMFLLFQSYITKYEIFFHIFKEIGFSTIITFSVVIKYFIHNRCHETLISK